MEESAAGGFSVSGSHEGAGVEKGIICIEDNKPDAIKAMEEASKPYPGSRSRFCLTAILGVAKSKLIEAVLGRGSSTSGASA